MALFLRRDDNRTELQNRVAAELSERLKNKQQDQMSYEKPEPAILENQQQLRPARLVITILIILFVALILWLLRP